MWPIGPDLRPTKACPVQEVAILFLPSPHVFAMLPIRRQPAGCACKDPPTSAPPCCRDLSRRHAAGSPKTSASQAVPMPGPGTCAAGTQRPVASIRTTGSPCARKIKNSANNPVHPENRHIYVDDLAHEHAGRTAKPCTALCHMSACHVSTLT